MQTFLIRKVPDTNLWVPDHPECEHVTNYGEGDPENPTDPEVIRQSLFSMVDAAMPGVYTLEWLHPDLQRYRIRKVDERTDQLIAQGFSYQGKTFSTSANAQRRYAMLRSLGTALSLPRYFANIDDTDVLVISDALTLSVFLGTAINAITSPVELGAQLKKQILDATTIEDVNAIVDTR